MKTPTRKSLARVLLTLVAFLVVTFSANATRNITMEMRACGTPTQHSMTYEFWLVNTSTAGENFWLRSYTPRFTLPKSLFVDQVIAPTYSVVSNSSPTPANLATLTGTNVPNVGASGANWQFTMSSSGSIITAATAIPFNFGDQLFIGTYTIDAGTGPGKGFVQNGAGAPVWQVAGTNCVIYTSTSGTGTTAILSPTLGANGQLVFGPTCNVVVNAPLCSSPTVAGQVTNQSCSSATDGAIDVTTTGGGSPAYTWLWSNGATTEDVTGLAPGIYTVTATTSVGGCTAAQTFTVEAGPLAVEYFADGDGDTYGGASLGLFCIAPPASSLVGGDCNDNNNAIHPGAAEVCNGIDDDCDLDVDEGLTYVTYYTDGDLDTYGTGAGSSLCANPGAGFSTTGGDCNDANAAINPGAQEICDGGIDNDCDGLADNDDSSVQGQLSFYADLDGDGYGAGAAVLSCTAPAGHVASNTDCADNMAAVNPGAQEICNGGIDDDCDGLTDDADPSATGQTSWYADGDADGFGAGAATLACVAPAGHVSSNTDCNDASAAINPGAQEICNGGIDDDCDGAADDADPSTLALSKSTFYADGDADGYGAGAPILACVAPAGTAATAGDCDDSNAAIHPFAAELCNGIDDDCDTDVDEGLTYTTYYTDGDNDGYGVGAGSSLCANPGAGFATQAGDCNDAVASINPGAVEQCNNIDDNCDGTIDNGVTVSDWYADSDNDGFGNPAVVLSSCSQPAGYVGNDDDCNDANAAINPTAIEVCDGGVDNDCDGLADDADPSVSPASQSTFYADADGDTYGAGAPILACVAPAGTSSQSGDCDDTNNAIHPGATETCNLVDDNCNGTIDEGVQSSFYADGDNDGYGAGAAVLACTAPAGHVSSNTDCDDSNSAINPAATEVCNDVDDDCDGLVDEGLASYTYFADGDGDTYGNASAPLISCHAVAPSGYVTNASDCDDNNASVNPAGTEVCNGLDDNCDGTVDEGCFCTNPATANAGINASICEGETVSLTGAIGGSATTSTWTTSGSGSFGDASLVVTTYFPSAADIAAGSVTLTLTTNDPDGSGPCVEGTSFMIVTINGLPDPAGAINGPAALCYPQTPITYNVAVVPGASSYNWTVPSGTTILSGQGTPSITVSWPFSAIHAGVKGQICVTAQNSNACGSATASCLDISVQLSIPVTPNSISGPAKACAGDVATYSVAPVARADYYIWTLPAGAQITSATSNTNIIQVTYDNTFAGGTLAVKAGNACGIGVDRTRNVGLNILSAPVALSGPVTGVCGATGVIYSVPAVVGATGYNWTVPAGASIVGPANGSSIVVDFSGAFSAGNITVSAFNNCGTGAVRSAAVKGAPATPVFILAPLTVCAGGTAIYEVQAVAGATSYVWTVPTGASIINGLGTKTVTVQFGATLASGQAVSVRATNGCGTSSTRTQTGIAITSCARIGDTGAMALNAFPNPANEILNITFSSDVVTNANLRLVDVTGRVVYNQAAEVVEGFNTAVIRVKGMASGIYTLQLQLEDRAEQIRIFVE